MQIADLHIHSKYSRATSRIATRPIWICGRAAREFQSSAQEISPIRHGERS